VTDRCIRIDYPDGAYCVQCAEQPEIPYVPAHFEEIEVQAWDTGADLIEVQEAPCFVEWQPFDGTGGAVMGFFPAGTVRNVRDPTTLAAAWYVFTVDGTMYVQARTGASARTSPMGVNSSNTLRIEHVGNRAVFKIDGTIVTMATIFVGLTAVGASLYSSDDAVPSPTFDVLADPMGHGEMRGSVSMHARGSEFANGMRAVMRVRATGRVGSHMRAKMGVGVRGGQGASSMRARMGGRFTGFSGIITPTPSRMRARMRVRTSASGHAGYHGTMHATMHVRAKGSEFANYMRARMRVRAHAEQAPLITDGVIMLQMNPGWLIMTIGYAKETLTDTIDVAANPIVQLTNVINESLELTETPASLLDGLNRVGEALEFTDRVGIVWRMLLADRTKFTDPVVGILEAAERMVENMRLVAGVGSSIDVRSLVAETLAVHDTLAVVAKEQISEQADFDGVFSTMLAAKERLLDDLVLTAVPTAAAQFSFLIEENIALSDAAPASLEAFERLVETVNFAVTVSIGDDVFMAWVVNTETRAAWEYENYPFNSMFEFQARHYGIAPDGMYELEGDTDNGADVKWRARLGLNNLGSMKEKRLPAMYLAYDTAGAMVLKVISTRSNGERVTNWYRLNPTGGRGVREGRIQIGRGIKSVYWDFELVGCGNTKLRLSELRYFPMILDRRIRRRNS